MHECIYHLIPCLSQISHRTTCRICRNKLLLKKVCSSLHICRSGLLLHFILCSNSRTLVEGLVRFSNGFVEHTYFFCHRNHDLSKTSTVLRTKILEERVQRKHVLTFVHLMEYGLNGFHTFAFFNHLLQRSSRNAEVLLY